MINKKENYIEVLTLVLNMDYETAQIEALLRVIRKLPDETSLSEEYKETADAYIESCIEESVGHKDGQALELSEEYRKTEE